MKLWGKGKTAGDVLRCSFCNKSQRDVRKLVAGPSVQICDGCIGICLDIVSEDLEETRASREPKGHESSCVICGSTVQAEGLVQVGVWGKVCQGCAEDVRDALLVWHQDHDGAAG